MTAEIIQFGERQQSRSPAAQPQPRKESVRPLDWPAFEATIATAAKSGNVPYLAGLFETFMSAMELLKNFRNQPRIYEYEDEIEKGAPIDREIKRLDDMLEAIAGELERMPSVHEWDRDVRARALVSWAIYSTDDAAGVAMVALAKAAATPVTKSPA
jgi:hypothetical protein